MRILSSSMMFCVACSSVSATADAQRRRAVRTPAFASVDDLVLAASCSVANLTLAAKEGGQPVTSVKGEVTTKEISSLGEGGSVAVEIPIVAITSGLVAAGQRDRSVTVGYDIGLTPGAKASDRCKNLSVRVFDAKGSEVGRAKIDPLFTFAELVKTNKHGCIDRTRIAVTDGFAIERKANVGVSIDLKIVKFKLTAGQIASKSEMSYAVEFTFQPPATNRCGFTRPPPKKI